MIKVGINGFGRIGRLAARIILKKYAKKLQLACINTSGRIPAEGWAHLFEYDSVYGRYQGNVSALADKLIVDGKKIALLGEIEPEKIPWHKYKIEAVIEATGVFLKESEASKHLRKTVKRVILSAPAKEGEIPMYVLGVNEKTMGKEKIISCASCTTNCAAPVAKVIDETFGVEKALMTTVHAYTGDQRLLDGSHKDLRRARAAAINIVPTTTGAAKATGNVYPLLKGKFDGLAVRVPVATASLTDFVFLTKKKVSLEEVKKAFLKAASGELKGILGVTEKPIVSSDIIGMEYSALVDLSLTYVVDNNLLKIIAWYDNEWGYCNRLVETTILAMQKL